MSYEFRGQTRAKTDAARGRRPARTSLPDDTGAPPPARLAPGRRSLMQIFAAVMGAAFLVAGLGGFIPGVTSNCDQPPSPAPSHRPSCSGCSR